MPIPPGYPKLRLDQAQALVLAGQSPRYRELDKLQRFYDCSIYDGRPAFMDGSVDVPLQERKPCVIVPVVASAVESMTSFALGEGKFPVISALSNEDDSDNGGLNTADSATLDAFNARLVEGAKLEAASRQLIKMAQASRSVAAVLGFRKGLPVIEAIWSKCCTPEFDPGDPDTVVALEVSYRYVEQNLDTLTGEWQPVVFQYRRRIDAVADTTYVPVPVMNAKDFPKPSTPDKTKTVVHGFGLCPVIWWKCMSSNDVAASVDGIAIHERVCDMVVALDISLSQRHRAALYCGDPQVVMTGVDPDQPVGPMGRRARIEKTPNNPTGDPAKAGEWGRALNGNVGPTAMKKGAGVVWATEDPASKIGLMTLPSDALGAIDGHANDLLNKMCESMHVVRIDPIALRGSGDISAKAMLIMYAKQLSKVAQLRQDFTDKCLLPLLNLFYQMLLKRPDGVFVPGLAKALPVLLASAKQTVDGQTLWFGPKLKLTWPDYFDPSDLDETARVTNANLAKTAGFITLATAVEHVKSVFNIANPDQYVDELAKEKLQNQADAIKNAGAMAKATAPAVPPPAAPQQNQAPSGSPGASAPAGPAAPPKAPKAA